MCGSKLGGKPDRGSLGELTAGAQKGRRSDRSECRDPGQWQGSLISPMKRVLDEPTHEDLCWDLGDTISRVLVMQV